ncbi:uncharacterized protein K452DRAFT_227456 [Aplosporella prunicola CBS 121167]|uniref:Uncharacterized protein n=1 Tax=Aplosporella prunicola CBS 121167 TaxID=1176127 RepID=A0A6A6BFT5_9PEZI|nr:uncharacterized protein K452DRAFT_227456 [Aplosporella prunicola CBS 121167]KAF2142263.1 hypothetical protein K452DRAFT_227456 [Aplosporella prunicola CBS 121167]
MNGTLPKPELLDLASGVVGGLFRPASDGAKAAIGILVMHAEQDYLTFSACTELPKRGYTVLCANNDASKSGYMTDLDFESMMQEVALGVSYLRNQTDISQVVLLGHSGGGAMMSAYQNIAENGLAACQGSEKIYPCSENMSALPKADGVMLLDANYGIASMALLSLNPAITDETSGLKINSSLDLFAPENGFSEKGGNYSAVFTKAFQSGVVARMQRLVSFAEERLKAINAGNGSFSDDEDFYIPDASYIGFNNKLISQDVRFLSHTSQPWPLLHKNGSTTTQIVHSVRVASTIGSNAKSYTNGAIKTTIKRFLSAFALRVRDDFSYGEDSFTGVVWNSSHMVPIAAAPGITVPLLTLGMTGHYEYLNAEKIYLNAGSKDKSIAFVEGAQHTINTCTECESYPGEFGDTTKTAYDYMGQWLGKEGRFI